MQNLTNENFLLFASRYYTNTHCTDILEFHDDLKRIRYIKRLFKKFKETGELKERLIINHLVILYNSFEPRAMTRMLFLKLWDYMDYLKPFLIMLNFWTTNVGEVNGKRVIDSEVSLNSEIVASLRKI